MRPNSIIVFSLAAAEREAAESAEATAQEEADRQAAEEEERMQQEAEAEARRCECRVDGEVVSRFDWRNYNFRSADRPEVDCHMYATYTPLSY